MLGYSITQDVVASYQNYKYEDLYLLLKKQALYMYATSSLFILVAMMLAIKSPIVFSWMARQIH